MIFDLYIGERVAVTLKKEDGIVIDLTAEDENGNLTADCSYFEGKLHEASSEFGCIRLLVDARLPFECGVKLMVKIEPHVDVIIPFHSICGIELLLENEDVSADQADSAHS